MTPIPVQVRRRIIALYDRGKKTGAIADALGYCVAAVRRVRQHLRERGTLDPATHKCGRRGRFTPQVRAELARRAGRRHAGRAGRRPGGRAAGAGRVAVHGGPVAAGALGRHAKKKSAHAAEQSREDVAAARAAWPATVAAACGGDVTKLVSLDESAATTAMARTHARSARGERAVAAVPAGHGRVLTMLGAVALRGVVAAASVAAATDGPLFDGYLADAPCPRLRPGDVVVMDNLSAHKRPAVAGLVAAAGATVLYLPPYSPDPNPIERVWAKVKALLRSAAARTVPDLHAAIGRAFGQVTLDDLLGCFADCGYRPAT